MRLRWLSKLLLPRMLRLAAAREPDFMVTRDEGIRIYLKRWWLIPRNNYFNIYLHNMLLDDDATLHDHPYFSLSLVLTDGLTENFVRRPDKIWNRKAGPVKPYVKMEYYAKHRDIEAGALLWRGSHFAHQLVVQNGRSPWTIFITGPRIRTWGFWCPRGFRPWDKYVSVTQDPSGKMQGGKSNVGIGCGEQS